MGDFGPGLRLACPEMMEKMEAISVLPSLCGLVYYPL